MAVYFISRHQGAIDWVKTQDLKIDHFVTHLDVNDIQEGDIVIGTLPIHLAAEVCAKGAKFYFLSINVNPEQRGQELSASQLQQQGCTIKPFYIKAL